MTSIWRSRPLSALPFPEALAHHPQTPENVLWTPFHARGTWDSVGCWVAIVWLADPAPGTYTTTCRLWILGTYVRPISAWHGWSLFIVCTMDQCLSCLREELPQNRLCLHVPTGKTLCLSLFLSNSSCARVKIRPSDYRYSYKLTQYM